MAAAGRQAGPPRSCRTRAASARSASAAPATWRGTSAATRASGPSPVACAPWPSAARTTCACTSAATTRPAGPPPASGDDATGPRSTRQRHSRTWRGAPHGREVLHAPEEGRLHPAMKRRAWELELVPDCSRTIVVCACENVRCVPAGSRSHDKLRARSRWPWPWRKEDTGTPTASIPCTASWQCLWMQSASRMCPAAKAHRRPLPPVP